VGVLTRKRTFFLLTTPGFLLYLVFVIIPIIMTFRYSLTNYTGLVGYTFSGFRNFILLFQDKIFLMAVKNVGIMLLIIVPVSIPFSFLLAWIINTKFIGNSAAKTIFFTPYIIAPIAVGLVFMFVFSPSSGLINTLLRILGFEEFQPIWIGGLHLTPVSASIVNIWSGVGYYMAIFLAGMKMIPDELYEACRIDGASKLQEIFHITIPMLTDSFKIVLIFLITNTIKIYESIFMLSGGGPSHRSESIISLMNNIIFVQGRYGYGMTIAIVQLVASILLSLFLMNLIARDIGK